MAGRFVVPHRRRGEGALSGAQETAGQAGRYALVGVAATSVDWAVFALLNGLGVVPEAAAAVSVMGGTVTNFVLNRRFTFRSDAPVTSTGPRYAIVWCVAFVATVGLVGGLTQIGVPPMLARIATTGVMFPANFVMLKLFAFRDAASSHPAGGGAKGAAPEDA